MTAYAKRFGLLSENRLCSFYIYIYIYIYYIWLLSKISTQISSNIAAEVYFNYLSITKRSSFTG